MKKFNLSLLRQLQVFYHRCHTGKNNNGVVPDQTMFNFLSWSVLLGILLLATFLRFYQLSSVPPAASLDEASLGWNTYSLLKTGRDEYGNKFPVLLRAYDDYRPALYVYTIFPFIQIFDLNVLAVRLPSAILSVLTVFLTYFLVLELFQRKSIALLSAFLLAISPWHIYISRLGHEVNLGLATAVFAIYFFIVRKVYLSAFFFALSFMSYQTEKIFIPVILFGIFLIYKDELLRIKRKVAFAFFISLVILAPFIKASLKPEAFLRFKATNVFEASSQRFENQSRLLQEAVVGNDILGQLFYNRRIVTAQIFAEGYLYHFNPVWLFTNPSEDKHKVPGLGLLYLWELPFILIGIYGIISGRFQRKTKLLLFLWFLTSPLAASITTDAPHALRSLVFLPTWQIFTSLGIIYFYNLLRSKIARKIFLGISLIVMLSSLLYFYRQYFFVFPRTQSESFQYALSRAIPYVVKHQELYGKVIFANSGALYQSYMFYLFYSKYDPREYLREGGTKSGGFAETHKFSKFEFRPIEIEKEQLGNLYIGNLYEFADSSSIKLLKVVKNLDGEKAIAIVTK